MSDLGLIFRRAYFWRGLPSEFLVGLGFYYEKNVKNVRRFIGTEKVTVITRWPY